MKLLLETLSILFQNSRKNSTIRTSMAISLIVFAMWFGIKVAYYKTQVEKIPSMEQKIQDHDKIVQLIPQMADDIRWLTRSRRGK